MPVTVVRDKAEQELLSQFEPGRKGAEAWGVLHFQSSSLLQKPAEPEIVSTIGDVLEDIPSHLYLFHNGDIAVAWSGEQSIVLKMLRSRLYASFSRTVKNLHKYYDMLEHVEDLRVLCRQLLEKRAEAEKNANMADDGVFTFFLKPEAIQTFREGLSIRDYRTSPQILIVEDQPFSSNILMGLLTRNYKTYSAPNAKVAWKIYMECAPDIVFLDIELPEIGGHQLAGEIRKLDEQAFIVMVTGNNYAKDVRLAIDNGAMGFIAKPFSKQQILNSISLFQRQKKTAQE